MKEEIDCFTQDKSSFEIVLFKLFIKKCLYYKVAIDTYLCEIL